MPSAQRIWDGHVDTVIARSRMGSALGPVLGSPRGACQLPRGQKTASRPEGAELQAGALPGRLVPVQDRTPRPSCPRGIPTPCWHPDTREGCGQVSGESLTQATTRAWTAVRTNDAGLLGGEYDFSGDQPRLHLLPI